MQDFVTEVQAEDKDAITSLQILRGKTGATKPVKESDSLYDQLQDRSTPIYLKLNEMMYKFDTQTERGSEIDLSEKS